MLTCYICQQEGRADPASGHCEGCQQAICRTDSVRTIKRLTLCNFCEANRSILSDALAQTEEG